MKSTALYNRMKKAGFGYRACASAINAKFQSDVHYYDVYKFVTKNFAKIGKERRKIIRAFFIAKGWIAAPKKENRRYVDFVAINILHARFKKRIHHAIINALQNNLMDTLEKLLYTMIKSYESEQQLIRDDYSFDAFEHLSKKLGHKYSSTLRKMCGPKSSRSGAKLGLEDSLILMTEMNDFRLLSYITEELKRRKKQNEQLNLIFSKPQTEL